MADSSSVSNRSSEKDVEDWMRVCVWRVGLNSRLLVDVWKIRQASKVRKDKKNNMRLLRFNGRRTKRHRPVSHQYKAREGGIIIGRRKSRNLQRNDILDVISPCSAVSMPFA